MIREVVAQLDKRQADAMRRAHQNAVQAEALLRSAAVDRDIAVAHFVDMLAMAANEDPAGLKFDAATGHIYREVEGG